MSSPPLPSTSVETETDDSAFSKLKYAELLKLCKQHGLKPPVKSKKKDLVFFMQQHSSRLSVSQPNKAYCNQMTAVLPVAIGKVKKLCSSGDELELVPSPSTSPSLRRFCLPQPSPSFVMYRGGGALEDVGEEDGGGGGGGEYNNVDESDVVATSTKKTVSFSQNIQDLPKLTPIRKRSNFSRFKVQSLSRAELEQLNSSPIFEQNHMAITEEMVEILTWLQDCGLNQLEAAFKKHEIFTWKSVKALDLDVLIKHLHLSVGTSLLLLECIKERYPRTLELAATTMEAKIEQVTVDLTKQVKESLTAFEVRLGQKFDQLDELKQKLLGMEKKPISTGLVSKKRYFPPQENTASDHKLKRAHSYIPTTTTTTTTTNVAAATALRDTTLKDTTKYTQPLKPLQQSTTPKTSRGENKQLLAVVTPSKKRRRMESGGEAAKENIPN